MQWFFQNRDEEQVNNNDSCETPDKDPADAGAFTLLVHYFRKTEPLSGGAQKDAFE